MWNEDDLIPYFSYISTNYNVRTAFFLVRSNEVTTHATECHQWLKKEKNKLPLFLPGFKDTIVQTEVSFLQVS